MDALLPGAEWPVGTNAPLAGFNPPEADYKTEWPDLPADIAVVPSRRFSPYSPLSIGAPVGHAGTGWIKIVPNSYLLNGIDPSETIDITGLNTPFQITAVGQNVWLEINVATLFDVSPGAPTASIQHGADWNGGGAFFPVPVKFDTDDGSLLGSGGSPPTNRKQTKCYVPLAFSQAPNGDPDTIKLTSAIDLVQCAWTHLRLYQDCYKGAQVYLAMPWNGPIYLP